MAPMREPHKAYSDSIQSVEEMDTTSLESLSYECKRCSTHIADEEDKQSSLNTTGWGPFDIQRNIKVPSGFSNSSEYFEKATNYEEGPMTKVSCESVTYNICYVYCKGCNRELGRKYTPSSCYVPKKGGQGTFVLREERLKLGGD